MRFRWQGASPYCPDAEGLSREIGSATVRFHFRFSQRCSASRTAILLVDSLSRMALPNELTSLINRMVDGDAGAEARVYEALDGHLQGVARAQLRKQGPGVELCTGGLVNEVYLRIKKSEPEGFQSRGQFLSLFAKAMRTALVDQARRRQRRQPSGIRVDLADAVDWYEDRAGDLLALDEALCLLERDEPLAAKVVELRFFLMLTVDEAAVELHISPRTCAREWQSARLALRGYLS